MTEQRERYSLVVNTAGTGIMTAAEAIIVERNGEIHQFGFRYTPDWLQHQAAFPLDPVHLPLQPDETEWMCHGKIPGLLNDYLPDAWGRRILSSLALYRNKTKLNPNSCIDALSLMGSNLIGTVLWLTNEETAQYGLGIPLKKLAQAETESQLLDAPNPSTQGTITDEITLLYLANSGTGVGGARPKALVEKQQQGYLAKFNRITHDSYNNARVELACLNMAKAGGIDISSGETIQNINKRDVLILKRFDITPEQTRHHLLSVQTLLGPQFANAVFRYDDIANLIKQYSYRPEQDLIQLLKIMLFNRGINNTDDHERNFSFLHDGEGYRLAPAYDLVPSLVRGAYHVAGFAYQPSPPSARDVLGMGKVFGLPKTKVKTASEEVTAALKNWEKFAEKAEVSEQDHSNVKTVIKL